MKGTVLFDNDTMLPTGTTPHGACYISTPAATTVTTAGTFYLLQGTTTAIDTTLFTHSSPGRLTYTGTVTKTFFVTAMLSVTSSVNNLIIKIRIAKNGTTIAGSEQQYFKTTSTDVKPVSTQYVVTLATNDYVELYVTSDVNGSTETAQTGVFILNEN